MGVIEIMLYGKREEMKGIRERYERALRHRANEKLEEARAKFQTKITATINESKSCEAGADRCAEEIRR